MFICVKWKCEMQCCDEKCMSYKEFHFVFGKVKMVEYANDDDLTEINRALLWFQDVTEERPRHGSPEVQKPARVEPATSPPPNCAICLGTCVNKCFTDCCLHQFCFNCLLEWSKVNIQNVIKIRVKLLVRSIKYYLRIQIV